MEFPSAQMEETARKEKKAAEALARAEGFQTVEERSAGLDLVRFDSPWVERVFGGPFYRSREPREPDLPVVSVVFVQDKNGNAMTASGNPADLQGGPTDLHGIYEGLSRLDADAVAAGSKTLPGPPFSVWHPEWIAMRRSLGLGRHPAQVVVSGNGRLDFGKKLLFNLPDLSVYVITSREGVKALSPSLVDRPWIVPIDAGDPLDWRRALRTLKERHGVRVLSLVGGPTTATAAVDQGVVTDLYLTTSAADTGLPDTPWYKGAQLPPLDLVVRKSGRGGETGVVFEHFVFKR